MCGCPELIKTEDGLALSWEGMLLRGDFSPLIPRIRPDRLRSELIIKAAKYDKLSCGRPPTALDATAGLGEDSFLLAAAGFRVVMYERDPQIFSLLEDALKRAQGDPVLRDTALRMTALCADSKEAMLALAEQGTAGQEPPDLIYLDPMFPARKKSGLIKKKFQILQQLEAPDEDGEALIGAAFAAGPRRIIVKRPVKAAPLGGIKPDYSIKGDIIRYDCMILKP